MSKAKGSGKTYVSKGERRSSMRTRQRDPGIRLLNQLKALQKGKDVVYTVENPNKEQKDKPFIRVRVSGKDYVKNQKYYAMKGSEA